MKDFSLTIEDDKDGETETGGIVEALKHGLRLSSLLGILRLAGIIVHMDIYEVLVDDLTDGGIFGDEVGKAKAPRTPVASHLTDHKLATTLGLSQSLINLCHGIDLLVIDLL